MTKTRDRREAGSVTVENVDDQELARAAKMLGTNSPQDTVNLALREVVRLRMVHEYVHLMKRAAAEKYEDPRIIAWQSRSI